jgi:hypothetical protein
MAKKVCPNCKLIRECTLISEGFHLNVYKCTTCALEFEHDGTGKKILSVLGPVCGGILTFIGLETWMGKHHNKK